jgi:hypothetical protein
MNKIIKNAFIDAIGTAVYVVLVASFLYFLQGNVPKINTVLVPIAMLLLFVFSAALTGFLVFGRPVMLYLDGKKREAILLIGYTLSILLVMVLLFFVLLVVSYSLIV